MSSKKNVVPEARAALDEIVRRGTPRGLLLDWYKRCAD